MSIDVENYFECEAGQAKLYKLRMRFLLNYNYSL